MATVRVTGLVKSYGGSPAVAGIDLTVDSGEFVSLLGPSGCGKTTTLRCIAGLEVPDTGEIRIGDQVVVGPGVFVPPERRNIGMVFQSYAVWPHMTVFDNVAYGLQLMKLNRREIQERVAEVLDLVGLRGYESRMGTDLSGGQQQRVAIARSVALRPQVLLFDEPLSNLDAKLRTHMRTELRRLQRRIGITSIYVTHDQEEAMAISDRLVLMNDGRVEQEGTPYDVYEHPATPFAAAFVGTINWFCGVVASWDRVMLRAGGSDAISVTVQSGTKYPVGTPVRVGIRPAQVRLSPGEIAGENVYQGRIVESTYLGSSVEVTVEVNGLTFQALAPPEPWLMEGVGSALSIRFDPQRVHLFPAEGEFTEFSGGDLSCKVVPV